jgi:Uma2 family endonuclease
MKPLARTPRPTSSPALYNGDRMTQPEFHRRYEAYPEDVKFELIGGTVYMASAFTGPHGTYHFKLGLVLGLYEAVTPGIEGADYITTILGEQGEPQPDLMLRLLKECGGQSEYNEEKYLVGAPELVAEVAHSSKAIDMGGKRKDYQAAGVQEYIVLCIEEQELYWFHFPSHRKLKPDRKGVFKSHIFPGLWLNGPALLARDSARLIATVQLGLASAEHETFVRQMQEKLAH